MAAVVVPVLVLVTTAGTGPAAGTALAIGWLLPSAAAVLALGGGLGSLSPGALFGPLPRAAVSRMAAAADRVVRGGEIHLGDETHGAVAVRDERMVRRSADYEASFLTGVETRVVDIEGRRLASLDA